MYKINDDGTVTILKGRYAGRYTAIQFYLCSGLRRELTTAIWNEIYSKLMEANQSTRASGN